MAQRGVNRVTLIGNLGADPKANTGGQKLAVQLSVATSESWKDKNTGEQRENTEWHKVVAFGRIGEIARDYLKKGSKVYIEGKLQTRKWQDQGGIDRYTTQIVVKELQMLDRPNNVGQSSGPAPEPEPVPGYGEDDDIPF